MRVALTPPAPWSPPDPSREHAALEDLTVAFRAALARRHVARVREVIALYRRALVAWEDELADGVLSSWGDDDAEIPKTTLDVLRESLTTRKWHEGRERGQRYRFDKVRTCGVRMMIAACGHCGEDRKPVPEGCGVRRVCKRCDTVGAVQRRARFGRARGRCFVDGHRYGLTRHKRKGGRYTEKMLTLTVPHVALETAGGLVREQARDEVHGRILALWLAWPRFLRKVNRHFRERYEDFVTYHRAFEWTPAVDGQGHPHFHVYLWSPWIDVALLRAWWAEALRAVGWPVKRDDEGADVVRIDLRMLRQFDLRAVRELMKGGRRSALTLSRVETIGRCSTPDGLKRFGGPGLDAFSYAEGWTLSEIEGFCSDAVRARLYCALESRRLTQASRGFYLDDAPPICTLCGASEFRVRFQAIEEGEHASDVPCTLHTRGPPS